MEATGYDTGQSMLCSERNWVRRPSKQHLAQGDLKIPLCSINASMGAFKVQRRISPEERARRDRKLRGCSSRPASPGLDRLRPRLVHGPSFQPRCRTGRFQDQAEASSASCVQGTGDPRNLDHVEIVRGAAGWPDQRRHLRVGRATVSPGSDRGQLHPVWVSQMYRRFREDVTIVERLDRLLAREDDHVSQAARDISERECHQGATQFGSIRKVGQYEPNGAKSGSSST